jgi:hypothetical protein
MKNLRFDEFSLFIENYLIANNDRHGGMYLLAHNEIFSPFLSQDISKLSKAKASALLLGRVNILYEKLQALVKTHEADFWLSIIGRLPHHIYIAPDWRKYAQLAILKYSAQQEESSLGMVQAEHGVAYALLVTPEQLDDAIRVCFYSGLLSYILDVNQMVILGGKLILVEESKVMVTLDSVLLESVTVYNKRVPEKLVLHEIGLTTDSAVAEFNNSNYIYILDALEVPIVAFCSGMVTKFTNYFLRTVNLDSLRAILRMYEDAIQSEFGFGTDEIVEFFHGTTRNIAYTLPDFNVDENRNIICNFGIEDEVNLDKLKFLYSLCEKGALFFPEKHLVTATSKYPYKDGPKQTAKKRVAAFTTRLTQDFSPEKIVVADLNFFPFIFKSRSGMCFVNMSNAMDFFAHVLETSKLWFASQHGDRFTLFAKNYLEKNVPAIRIEGQNVLLQKKLLSDLVVIAGNTVYSIECKAYSKGKAFNKGSIAAFNQRNSMIAKGVKQAKKNCDQLARSDHFAAGYQYVWILCTASNEFIHPYDKYGLLDVDVPKVCTVEELGVFFKAVHNN